MPSNFQVFWSDLSYEIEPKITLGSLWDDCEQFVKSSLKALPQSFGCSKSYDINADVESNCRAKEPATIIQSICGSFKSGQLTGVMGPSGAGKTSLLNFLSRRREDGYTGQLYIDKSNKRIKINTIPQDDHLTEYLTVKENLMFASRLKNSNPDHDHEKHISKVSSLLGLERCLDTKTKKISGGQSKRLAIAQELLSKPDVLILDEPTSGLDSLTCYKTLTVLKDLVEASTKRQIEPIAIVLTIHQPQQEVFDIFDKIYVMAIGGRAIYNGSPQKCLEFIEKYAGLKAPDEDYNPASFLIEIASGEHGEEPIVAMAKQVKIEFAQNNPRAVKNSFSFSSKPLSEHVDKQERKLRLSICHDAVIESGNKDSFVVSPNGARKKSTVFIDQRLAKGSSFVQGQYWRDTFILTKRCWISVVRDPKQMIARLLFSLALPMILAYSAGTEGGKANACPNYSSDYKLIDLIEGDLTSEDVQEQLTLTLENLSFMFIMIYALTCSSIGATTLTFTLDMKSSLKEYYNGWYQMSSYLTARLLTEVPLAVILPIVTVSIGFPLSGQLSHYDQTDLFRILIASVALILCSMVGQTMGMIFGVIYIDHVSTALFASQGATLPLVFLSGIIVRTKNMSKFIYSLSFFSIYKHALDASLIARYGFYACGSCDPSKISSEGAKIVGIPENVKDFIKSRSILYDEEPTSNSTVSKEEDDLFKLFAKQISLYNTNGVTVKSCNDIKPYTLYDLSLDETNLPQCYIALLILLMTVILLLFLTVRIVLHYKKSL